MNARFGLVVSLLLLLAFYMPSEGSAENAAQTDKGNRPTKLSETKEKQGADPAKKKSSTKEPRGQAKEKPQKEEKKNTPATPPPPPRKAEPANAPAVQEPAPVKSPALQVHKEALPTSERKESPPETQRPAVGPKDTVPLPASKPYPEPVMAFLTQPSQNQSAGGSSSLEIPGHSKKAMDIIGGEFHLRGFPQLEQPLTAREPLCRNQWTHAPPSPPPKSASSFLAN